MTLVRNGILNICTQERKFLIFLLSDTWNRVYSALQQRLQNLMNSPTSNGTVNSEMVHMVGVSGPTLVSLEASNILASLENGSIDIGMCGYMVTTDRLMKFDFANPFYFMSGLQAVARKGADVPSIEFVLFKLMSTIDPLAQLIAVILLVCAVIFGHFVAAVENMRLAPKTDFRDNYFEGTQDGMWFSIVVMSTVGFGDIVPRTSIGRFLSIVWIFLSIALTTIFAAIITDNFGNLVLVPTREIESLSSPNGLAPYRVGVALQYAQDKLLQYLPNITLVNFPQNTRGQIDMLRCLLNGTIDVAVDRYEMIQFYNIMVDEFAGVIHVLRHTLCVRPARTLSARHPLCVRPFRA